MKKILSLAISAVMLVTAINLPAMAAVSNKYQTPTILPPEDTHPRVMMRSSDIDEIKANMSRGQNELAAEKFEELISGDFTSVDLGSTAPNYNHDKENKIEAFAFDYVINGNEESGRIAIDRLIEYLNSVKYDANAGLTYRYAGGSVFHAAEVYDWCYPLLTDSEKTTIISKCESILKNYMECGYPPTEQSSIVSHGSEAQILRDMLSFGIAVYDERPDIYNAVMGRIQKEMVPARNDMYRSGYIHQGTEYGWYRFYWDLYAQTLVDRMSEGEVSLFNKDDMKEVAYGMIYARRPDGRFFVEGDNKTTNYWYYNNFNQMTAKLAGDLFDDGFFKGEYRMMRGNEDFDNNNFKDERSFNAVNWLIMNDPDVEFISGGSGGRNPLPKAKYFGSPIGKIYAKTEWMYTKSSPATANAVAVEMKIGERYSANHDHLDAGTFQIYYRGLLTGEYGAQDNYNSDFDLDYYKRTVAHNALTIYDSSENFRFEILGASRANDGGQMPAQLEPSSFDAWVNNSPYNRAKVVNHSIADDYSYSYIKGNITPAYSSNKAQEVARSMVFLPTNNNDAPGIMVVYDKVTSKNANQTKKFLLHSAVEPTIEGSKTTIVNNNTLEYSNGQATYNGMLTVNTLLPANPTISKVALTSNPMSDSKYEPEWGRIEVQAATEGTTTQFLNVLTVSQTDVTPEDAVVIGDETSDFVGAKTAYNKVVMFSNTGVNSFNGEGEFVIAEGSDLDFHLFGMGEGRWTVRKDDEVVAVKDVSATDGTIAFEVEGDAAGTYTVAPYVADDIYYACALWYDYRLSDGSTQSTTADKWYDLTGKENDLKVPSKAKWVSNGLMVEAADSSVALPEVAKKALNGNQYTVVLAVDDINVPDNTKTLSIFGNVRDAFAIHSVIGGNKMYIKLPGWNTTLFRPSGAISEFAGKHHIIAVDKDRDVLKWYVDGVLKVEKKYAADDVVDAVNLITGTGSAVYQQVKVINFAVTADEAANEFAEYEMGF